MPGNCRGKMFKVMTWGESHGPSVGAVIDGCPPGLELEVDDIQGELDRRKPGQDELSSGRREADEVQVMSGLFEGKTLGTPISLRLENKDARPEEYEERKDIYRPSHADMTYEAKYGLRNWMGGGRASARETAARVAAGAVARKWLIAEFGLEIIAWVNSVHKLKADAVKLNTVTREAVEASRVRCPDSVVSDAIIEKIETAQEAGDSFGGTIKFVARNMRAGWGEPVFDKLEAQLGKYLLSIPAAKGVDIGSGFAGTELTGSEHNDEFVEQAGEIQTATNNSGGIQGGISNGMPLHGRVAFKPVPTISRPQQTVNSAGEEVTLEAGGRHDPCVLPRAVPIVEAELALVLADCALQQRGQTGNSNS